MIAVEHDFEAVLSRPEDNEILGRVPLDMDWVPAVEAVLLSGLRQDLLTPEELCQAAFVKPVWHTILDKPHVERFEVGIHASDRRDISQRFPLSYCYDSVLRSAKTLEKQGAIRDGETFNFCVTAYPETAPKQGVPGRTFELREVSPALHFVEHTLRSLDKVSLAHGDIADDDISVFIPDHVLDDTEKLTRDSPSRETGGILIGRICRDPESRDLFLSVSEQLPAKYTESTSTHLTFTPDTWAAVHAAIELRGQSEVILGFWHSHVPIEWCKRCPPERRANCHWAKGFFSADDRALHRTLFPRAYSIALVETFTEAGVKHDLFGWRGGLIEPRGFRILQGSLGQRVERRSLSKPEGQYL